MSGDPLDWRTVEVSYSLLQIEADRLALWPSGIETIVNQTGPVYLANSELFGVFQFHTVKLLHLDLI